jgi:molybdopterin/thiamine biosynthesis adenylyltransferase
MFSVYLSWKDYESLQSSLFTRDAAENAAFALGGFARIDRETRVLVRRIMPVPEEAYLIRSRIHLEIAPKFINKVIDHSEGKLAIMMMHSHPEGLMTEYSASDDFGEERLFRVFDELLPGIPHASLLFSGKEITGRYWTGEGFKRVDRVRVVGNRIQDLDGRETRTARSRKDGIFARQVSAFGRDGQATLSETRVGIVGVGGTGSAVAEQLVRMGVKDITLVDNDTFEASNLTRMYGSSHADISKREKKTNIVARHLRSIEPKLTLKLVDDSIVKQSVLMHLRDRDVVFSCTDNDWSRSVLNRFAHQYFIPVINMGMRIVVDEDHRVKGSAGRVSLVASGLPCLLSLHRIDSERVRVESMIPEERKKLLKEKYIEGLQVTGPSVISVNSVLSSLGVTMLLGLLTDFSTVPLRAPEQIYDALEGIVFTAKSTDDPSCRVCGTNGLKGLGDLQIVSAYE